MKINSYKHLMAICENLADSLHTEVKMQDYPECGWASVFFQTDNFGGCYTLLHYDHLSGVLTKDYGTDKAKVIDTVEQLHSIVKEDLKYMLANRDMAAVSEFINSQYD